MVHGDKKNVTVPGVSPNSRVVWIEYHEALECFRMKKIKELFKTIVIRRKRRKRREPKTPPKLTDEEKKRRKIGYTFMRRHR